MYGDGLAIVQPLRQCVAAVYLLVGPGYSLSLLLFPQPDALDRTERIGLSLGLSVALIPVLALILDALPWGISRWPIIIGETGLALTFALASLMRPTLPPAPGAETARWNVSLRRAIVPLVGMGLVACIAIGLVGLTLALRTPPSTATEFYMLGAGMQAENYPTTIEAGQQQTITIGVNNPGPAQRYRVEARLVDRWRPEQHTLLSELGPFNLAAGEQQRWPLQWQIDQPGNDQSIDIFLFVEGQSEPIRQLTLWVNVR
jgi:uncharacterized membrane protein